ncbi:hypothetical protein D9M68_672630 [compost metagenome]
MPGSGPAQSVAGRQGLAVTMQAAELFTGDAGAAAKHGGGVEAAGGRQVGAGAVPWLGKVEALATAHGKAAPGRQRLAVQCRAEVGAGQGQAAVLLASQGEVAQGDFQHRGAEWIA